MTTDTNVKNKCCDCGQELSKATSVEDKAKPEPGHICICFYCGCVSVFNKDLTIRRMTKEEMDRIIAQAPRVYHQIVKIQRHIALNRQKN